MNGQTIREYRIRKPMANGGAAYVFQHDMVTETFLKE